MGRKEELNLKLIVKREWEVIDAGSPTSAHLLTIGTHEVERIQNPLGYPDSTWLVLKGTKIGAMEGSWRQWEGENWGDFQVIVEE